MLKKRNALVSLLVFHIVLMLIITVLGVWTVIRNPEFAHNGESVIMSSSLQIKVTLGLLLALGMIVYPLCLMIRLIDNLEKNNVFNNENIKIVERIKRTLMIFALYSIFGYSYNHELSFGYSQMSIREGALDIWGINLNISVFIMTVLSFITLIITMIEVLKEGINLKEENDLTV